MLRLLRALQYPKGLIVAVVAAVSALAAQHVGPQPGQIKNLVTFGDSYTDVVSALNATNEREKPHL